MLKTFPLLLGFILIISCCTPQQKVTKSADWKGASLKFGSGGGFTGASTIYTLLPNGQLFVRTGVVDGVEDEIPSISKKRAKTLFSTASKIKWVHERVSNPGNMYSTITYNTGKQAYEMTWGDGKYFPPADIQQLFKDLNSILPPKK